jgi:hypothetical protein
MQEAELVAVGSYMLVPEDSPELETPQNPPIQSDNDHGDVLQGMYTPDMLDEKEQPVLERTVITEDQARRLRERGAGGLGTVSGAVHQDA